MTYVNPKKLNQRRKTGWSLEKQRQINFYKKALDEKWETKPPFDIEGTDEERAKQQTVIMQWATSYLNIKKKLIDLGYEFKTDSGGEHQQPVGQDEPTEPTKKRSSRTKTRDLQTVSDIKS